MEFENYASRVWHESSSRKSVRRATLDGSTVFPVFANSQHMEVADQNEREANPCQSEHNGHIGVEHHRLSADDTLHMADTVEALQRRRRSSGGGAAISRNANAAPSSQVVLEIEHVGLCLRDFDLPLFSRREKASRTLRAVALRKMKADAEAKNTQRRSSLHCITPARGVQQAIQAMHPPVMALQTSSDALRQSDQLSAAMVGAESAGLHEGVATMHEISMPTSPLQLRRMRRRRASDPLPPSVPMPHVMSVPVAAGSAADSTGVTFALLPGMLPLAERGPRAASASPSRTSTMTTGTAGAAGARSPAAGEPVLTSTGRLSLAHSSWLPLALAATAPADASAQLNSEVVSRTQARRHQFIDI